MSIGGPKGNRDIVCLVLFVVAIAVIIAVIIGVWRQYRPGAYTGWSNPTVVGTVHTDPTYPPVPKRTVPLCVQYRDCSINGNTRRL